VRFLRPALLILGLAAIAFFVYRIGTQPIAEALSRLAWWQLVLVCLPYAVISAVDTLGWRFAFARNAPPFAHLLGARLAGEALNVVTAVGSVGGEAAKAWLIRRDVEYEESVPAVVIAKTTTTIAQALFLLIGAVLAWAALAVHSRVLAAMLWMLVVEALAVAGFVAVQVGGVVRRAGRLLTWFGVIDDAGHAEKLDASLRHYYRREWKRLSLSTGFHLAGWLLGAGEAFVMLWCLGVPTDSLNATVIEALGAGVRFATFLVPGSLGAFEGANAAAFEALGLGAGAGLAFSFVRRARQLVWIGISMLVLAAMGWRAGATTLARR
jgi:glycosyltransferase 2 family protein